ncbi:MAG: GTPase RsgA, partial [Eubacteriales bacterium]|nr:GTPase RsgA [Eubacteriales bacterium]
MSENNGLLISAISSFYQVWTGEKMVLCRARGKLRLNGTEPVPGDQVFWEWDRDHPGNGILTAIAERRNLFIRPNLANISRIVFVASAARPETDPFLVDCMSVVARENACDFMLCVNKTDLNDGRELLAAFRNCSFPVCCVSALTGEGIEALKGILMGGI